MGNKVKCTVCKKKLPRTSKYFHHDRSRGDGLNYRCKICSSKYIYNWSENNKNRKNIRVRETKYTKRELAIKTLGGKCICCGVTEWWNLTFDHIDYKTKIKTEGNMNRLYNKIINGQEHKKYQILCFGCNSSKHKYTECRIHNKGDKNRKVT
ncbi:MAG: hypothetical protein GWN01_05575 [Nitrosopumilaceae archaeon]|nr:hypothetical protein [Nitrosopumilaceae archaeon]NIU86818.1 hypothetical protein [Nitrosopumilaceae archaeon]NIX61015.1 hypothetical protein [Nitrosopumilaceae archaeon]